MQTVSDDFDHDMRRLLKIKSQTMSTVLGEES